MKRSLLLFSLLAAWAAPSPVQAQVAVGTTSPDASAILQVESTTKGFLPPRLTSAQRDAIPSPAQGLLIYNTTEKRLEFSDGSNWFNLTDGSSITAVATGTPSGMGEAGIGTNSPDPNAALELQSTAKGFLPPRLTAVQRDAIASPAEGLIVYNTESDCLEGFNGSYWTSLCVGMVPSGACAGEPTEFSFQGLTYKPVENPNTNECWLDRNLGASQVANARNDTNSYGDLYQWGRAADGHEDRNSGTTSTQSSTDVPGHGDFIIGSSDWRNPSNNNLWQGVNGTNNPCPSGYRLPNQAELDTELNTWDDGDPNTPYDASGRNPVNDAFASPLKLPLAGERDQTSGSLSYGSGGNWSSTVSGTIATILHIHGSNAAMRTRFLARGYSIRCIKD